MHHYVYRITNTTLKKHYYGKRSSKYPPAQDLGIKYFSSSTDKAFKQDQKDNPQDYKYKVARVFKTAAEAVTFEVFLHSKFNVSVNTSFYNKAKQTAIGFDTTGMKVTEERRLQMKTRTPRKYTEAQILERKQIGKSTPLPASFRENARVVNTGKILVVDPVTGTRIKVNTKDPRYLAGTLISINKGRVTSNETKEKQSAAHSKSANIYCYYTNTAIQENVVLAHWAKANGYSSGTLSATSSADRSKPSNKYNPHHHKGVYVKYNTKE